MFIDPRSRATRPAELSVHWSTYFRHYPQGAGWAAGAGMCAAGAGWIFEGRMAWPWGGIAAALFLLLHVRYVRTRFAGGMLCPALVLSEKPFLVAVLTDLASEADHSRPVLKIFDPPAGTPCAEGTRLATVVLYSGRTMAGHWDDCHPALAAQANPNPGVQATLLERVPAEEWTQLAAACRHLPLPHKRGLHRLHAA